MSARFNPRTHARSSQALYGFTLVELLVVVAVIVVVLALLAPALDQAVYQADLAKCATNLKGICGSVSLYASAHQRAYPYRQAMDPNPKPRLGLVGGGGGATSSWTRWNWPEVLVDEFEGGPVDDRPPLVGYLDANEFAILHDPLTGGDVDFTVDDYSVWVDYHLWWGVRYMPAVKGGKGLFRLGDRFEFQGDSYNVLASDRDVVRPNSAGAQKAIASHPDRDGVLYFYQDKRSQFWFSAWWQSHTTHERGTLDTNYAYTDGAVERFTAVKWNDTRMARLPGNGNATSYGAANDTGPSFWRHVPVR